VSVGQVVRSAGHAFSGRQGGEIPDGTSPTGLGCAQCTARRGRRELEHRMRAAIQSFPRAVDLWSRLIATHPASRSPRRVLDQSHQERNHEPAEVCDGVDDRDTHSRSRTSQKRRRETPEQRRCRHHAHRRERQCGERRYRVVREASTAFTSGFN
jgi:hypothetical protein